MATAFAIVALWVDDAKQAWRETTKRGSAQRAGAIRIFGRTRKHEDELRSPFTETPFTLFVERKNYHGPFLPGYVGKGEDHLARPTGLLHVDHVVGNVGWNEMNRWVEFYATVMGFSLYQHFDDKDISTEYSALMSKVMANGNGRVKFPLNEPAEGRRKSQIEEFLEFHHGPGVQHIALATNDILHTVGRLQAQGIEFLRVPPYLLHRAAGANQRIDEPVHELEKLGTTGGP